MNGCGSQGRAGGLLITGFLASPVQRVIWQDTKPQVTPVLEIEAILSLVCPEFHNSECLD